MTPEQFTYWLQGFVELNPNTEPTPEQWKMIQEHLKTVFTKVTPLFTNSPAKCFGDDNFNNTTYC